MDAPVKFALEVAGVGIWDMDFKTGVVQWSEILERQYGLEPGTFGGTVDAFIERIHPADRECVKGALLRARKSGADFSLKNRSVWHDGTVRWLTSVGRVDLDEHGEPVRGVGISLDVTDRHELEQQHQQAHKMEAIGQMAAGVAHDFNTLLTVILGYCELLLADEDEDNTRQLAIAEIQKAGESAARLTRQLLAFSRKQIIEPTVLDVNAIVSSMQAMLRRLIGEDVSVALVLRPRLAPVTADRGQIEQIIMNLAMNARDAMPRGGALSIETDNVEVHENRPATPHALSAGRYVTLTVTDTGTGMTPHVLNRLFEPFFTTKELGKGTGLGLATVYRIVESTGGTIDVSSEVGKGTSITVYFPKANAAEMVVEMPSPRRKPAGSETVLVVEDVEALRELVKRMLQRQGYSVLVAASAEEALGVFERSASIDVVLTDAVMPGASGSELIRQLMKQRPDLRVILMSGYAADAIIQHGLPDPGIAFLHKPFTSEALGQKIRAVLDR
jgi:two-component system, cell cycle sensor histidine kinase and response regulator CckA